MYFFQALQSHRRTVDKNKMKVEIIIKYMKEEVIVE
jgi:hypothetical protein